MSIQIPKHIRVLGQTFTVDVIARDESLFRGAPQSALGSCNMDLQRMRIRGPEDMSPMQAIDTTLHESLHALFYLHGFDTYLKDHHDNESFVGVLSTALLAMLRDNPDLVSLLMTDVTTALRGEVVRTDEHGHDGQD